MMSAPRHASTLIVLREGGAQGFEVLLTRRAPGLRFLGGFYVFPGGAVREDDRRRELLGRCLGMTPAEAQRVLRASFSADLALAHWVAAAREAFEETGLLFAADRDGNIPDWGGEAVRSRLAEGRRRLIRGEQSFLGWLTSEELFCDLRRIVYFSHWRTPEEFAERFDTRFFLAPLPPGQQPVFDSPEIADALWISPDQALALQREGRLPVIFPTYAALRTLADFDSLASVGRAYGLALSR